MTHVGRRAIYRENGLLLPVTVSKIRISRNWLEVEFQPERSPLPNSAKKSFTTGSALSLVDIRPGCWRGGYTWRIDFREEPYQAVLRVCEENRGLAPRQLFNLCAAAFEAASYDN